MCQIAENDEEFEDEDFEEEDISIDFEGQQKVNQRLGSCQSAKLDRLAILQIRQQKDGNQYVVLEVIEVS